MENPGRIQMERFIPVEIFWKKSNTSRGITVYPFLPKRPGFMSRESEKFTSILWMVQLNPVPVFGAKKSTSTIWRKFFTEIFVQIVSALKHR